LSKLSTVKTFGNDKKMEFGLDKCTAAVFKHGKLTKSQNISPSNYTVRGNTEVDETY